MGLLSDMVLEPLYQSGFSNTCITGEQDHLSVSSFNLLPPFQEETNFLLATNQGCESSWLCNIKATGGTTLTEHVVDSYGLSDTT
jgi:hypothetical protein